MFPISLKLRHFTNSLLFIATICLLPSASIFAAEPSSAQGGGLSIESNRLSIPDALPPGASTRELSLTSDTGLRLRPNMAILTRPGQVLRLTLEVRDPAPQARVVPPLLNAPEGMGPGGGLLEETRRVAWGWSAGTALDLTSEMLLYRTPARGGAYEIEARLLEWFAYAQPNGGTTNPEMAWAKATFPLMVGEIVPPGEFQIQGVAVGLYPNPGDADAPQRVQDFAPRYRQPRFMYKVTPETFQLPLSEHFVLGDFAMDARKFGDRQYIALEPELLARLEEIQAKLDRKVPGSRVRILRSYLTPLAAEALRREGANISTFSRYLYGDAAIIIADQDNDGEMDDLDGDGTVGALDIRMLAEICEEAEATSKKSGGLGIYERPTDPTLPDTPYIHIDLRGFNARWEVTLEEAKASPTPVAPPTTPSDS